MHRRTVISILSNTLGSVLLLIALLILVAWLIGLIWSDRWLWTQWLSWIPSLVLIPAGLFWLSGVALIRRLRAQWPLGVLLCLVGPMIFFFLNWQPANKSANVHGPGITISQWTLGTILDDEDAYAQPIVTLDSDISIIEGGRRVRWSDTIRDWLGPDHTGISTGIFSVFTRLPVQQLRSSIWSEGIHVARFDVEGPGFEAMPLKLLLVDLPSDPSRSRWEIAQRLQDLLTKVGPEEVDLIIGDFNMPSGSAALSSLFPQYTRAWSSGGEGWAPTFPRNWSIARLDHILVGPDVVITKLRTIDPGLGRHRLQTMRVTNRTDSPREINVTP
ncbi:MAG: endonuclease/exonuclease/phosphatase family protein [Planctomycetota bacterium]|nr:endonuclease/exonuclease/phosphatase family protein [Planctomycetota bacterium]